MHTHIYIHAYTYHEYTHYNTYIYTYAYYNTYIYAYTQHTHIHIFTHTTHTYIHARAHTHTPLWREPQNLEAPGKRGEDPT